MATWSPLLMLRFILFIRLLFACSHGPDKIYFCASLDTLKTNSLLGSVSYLIQLGANKYSYSHLTQSPSNIINFGSYISCFLIPNDAPKLCHEIYDNGSPTHLPLCIYNIDKISPLAFQKQKLQVPYKHTRGDYGEFTVYTSNNICITIQNANMINENEYYVIGSLYKIDGDGDSIQFTTYLYPLSIKPKWNQIICLPGNPSNDTSQIGIELSIVANTGIHSTSIQTQIIDRNNGNDQLFNIIFEDLTCLNMLYWESCDTFTKFNRMKTIQNKITAINFNFLLSLIIIAGLTIVIVCILSFVAFTHGDPINYYAIVWVVLELWDFESDIGFAIYLYYFYIIYGINIFLFCAATFFVVIPYISNLSYLNNLIKMWTQPSSAGASKDWLENKNGKYILSFICICCGGVHPALELCNSIIFPINIFSMHLPYAEHVRIRTERFLTNVAFENFPFLLIQICFWVMLNQHNDQDLQKLNSANYVFLGGVTSTLLSVIFSATYYFSFRHQQQTPETNYKFSFEIQSEQLKRIWIHSHWRLQTAISRAFQVPSPILIIIDKCHNIESDSGFSSKRMSVCGRILKDAISRENLDTRSSIGGSNAMERRNYLFKLIADTFNLNEQDARIYGVEVKSIPVERVFDLENANTMKWICCWCCCRANEKKFDSPERGRTFSPWVIGEHIFRKGSKPPPAVTIDNNVTTENTSLDW